MASNLGWTDRVATNVLLRSVVMPGGTVIEPNEMHVRADGSLFWHAKSLHDYTALTGNANVPDGWMLSGLAVDEVRKLVYALPEFVVRRSALNTFFLQCVVFH